MFVGRLAEIEALEQALRQTQAGQPHHVMVTGERGIGKTSLLSYMKWLARGELKTSDDHFSFLVVDTDIEKSTTPEIFARRMERALSHEIGKDDPAREFIKKTWGFLSRVEAGGVSLREASSGVQTDDLVDELAYSLASTAKRVCRETNAGAGGRDGYDGILIFIDEADSAGSQMQLGAMLKMITERLQKRECTSIMFVLAGLQNLPGIIRESHPSALRIFDEIILRRLTNPEVGYVIDRCMEEANEKNEMKTGVLPEARERLIALAEGYPHFIQQFGYSAFDADSDGAIDSQDVQRGAFSGSRSALKLIGDKYYRDNFYGKIQKESYRQVLRIMAEKLDQWISKRDIQAKFKGKDTTLNNALQALRERKIILSKEGARGVYRLQHVGFALWIKLYTSTESTELD